MWTPLLVVVLCSLSCSMPSQVHRKGDVGDEVEGMKVDTLKLRSDVDGSRKRGVSYGHLARHISQDSPLFQVVSS